MKAFLIFLRSQHPGFEKEDHISIDELNQFRRKYLTSLITLEKGELAVIAREVMDAIINNADRSSAHHRTKACR